MAQPPEPPRPGPQPATPDPSGVKYVVRAGSRTIEVAIHGEAPNVHLTIAGRPVALDVSRMGDPSLLAMLVDHTSLLAHVVCHDAAAGRYEVSIGGKHLELEVLDELAAMARRMHAEDPGGATTLEAPMPGLIVAVRVEAGQRVDPGSPLVVMEAMKMQNEFTADAAGIVREVCVQPGDAVESGARLVVLDPV